MWLKTGGLCAKPHKIMKRPVRTAVEGLSVGTSHLEAAARVPKCAGSDIENKLKVVGAKMLKKRKLL